MAAMLPGVGVRKSQMFPEWPLTLPGLDRFACGHVRVGVWDANGPTYSLVFICSQCRLGKGGTK